MINLKKTLVIILFFCSFVFSLYGTSTVSSNKEDSVRNVEESSIVIDDVINASVGNNASKKSDDNGNSGASVFIRMIVVLIVVVGLIYLVFYFIKKKTNYVKNDDEYLRRAAYINIAPGKTIEVITLIDKAYLIGVTEDNITMLGEINDDELIKAMNITADKKNNTKKPNTFSDVLDMFLVKGNKKKSVFDESDVGAVVSSDEDNKKDIEADKE